MAKRMVVPSDAIAGFKRWCCANGGAIQPADRYEEAFRVVFKKGICVFYEKRGQVMASGRSARIFNRYLREQI